MIFNQFRNCCFHRFFRIPAHRLALYAANNYFKVMFSTAMKERGQSDISIGGVDGDILRQLIVFCYGQDIAIDSENIDEMTSAASMLQFPAIKDKCAQIYSNILSASNCLGIRNIADLHSMIQLKEKAHRFALNHFIDVFGCEEFHHLDVGQLVALLKDDKINVASEEEVFDAVIAWVQYDINGRQKLFQSLCECVRFQLVDDSVSQ